MHLHRIVGAVAMLGLLNTIAAAQSPEPLGAPPQFVQIGEVDREAGQVEVLMTFFKTTYETREVQFEENGETKTKTVAVPRMIAEIAMQSIRLDDVRIVTAGKQRLEKAAALERLKPGMVILRHTSGKKIDSRYLSVLNPDAIIFVEQPGVPAGQPAPAVPAAPIAPAAPFRLPSPADAPSKPM